MGWRALARARGHRPPLPPARPPTRPPTLPQDTTAAGALRDLPSPIPFNYGMLPRTVEDAGEAAAGGAGHDPLLAGARGDGDPVDAVELSASPLPLGSVTRVRMVAALAMLDGGELDWKVVAVAAASPLAAAIVDVPSLEAALPGDLDRVVTWFSTYKPPRADGRPAVAFGHGGRPLPAAGAAAVVAGAEAAFLRMQAAGKV